VAAAARRHGRREAERLRGCGRHVALATRQGLAAADRDLGARSGRLDRAATGALARATTVVDRAVGRIESGGRAHLRGHDHAVAAASARLAQRAPRAVAAAGRELDRIEAQVRVLDPARTLARGWSITRTADGRVARSAAALALGDGLVTTLADGEVRSTVTGAPDPAGPGAPEGSPS
jgi:exodeoxyribonuclease VII large subunit